MHLVLVAAVINHFFNGNDVGMHSSMCSCVSMCRHDTSCTGFFYSRQDGVCYLADALYSNSMTRFRRLVWKSGYLYFEYANMECNELYWYYYRPSRTCFQLLPNDLSDQPGAQQLCTLQNTSLLVLETLEEINFYNGLAKDHYDCIWTSGTKVNGSWRWGNGEPIVLQDWKDGVPGPNACMCVDRGGGGWEDKPCSFGHRFVCERQALEKQESCSQIKYILP